METSKTAQPDPPSDRRSSRGGPEPPGRWRSWAVTALGLLLVGLLGGWATRSPVFHARSVRVSGNVHLAPADVLRAAKIDSRTNVLWLSPGAVEDRLEANAWILDAEVSRVLPSTLSLSVIERTAVAVVLGDRRYIVAADRTVLGVVGERSALPVIEGPYERLTIGESVPGPAPEIRILAALPPSVWGRVERVTRDERDLLVVMLRGGVTAVYGDASEASSKGAALLSVLRWAGGRGVMAASIDLRAPARPALLPGEPLAGAPVV